MKIVKSDAVFEFLSTFFQPNALPYPDILERPGLLGATSGISSLLGDASPPWPLMAVRPLMAVKCIEIYCNLVSTDSVIKKKILNNFTVFSNFYVIEFVEVSAR